VGGVAETAYFSNAALIRLRMRSNSSLGNFSKFATVLFGSFPVNPREPIAQGPESVDVPRSVRADGIGVWKSLLSCVIWMSALTNCLIVGFTSDQMKEIFPAFYMRDKGWIAVFVILGLERILLQEEVQRLHHVRQQEHEEVLRQVMRRRNHKKKN
jgi:hypothetical protein